jgi:hypothetical protein
MSRSRGEHDLICGNSEFSGLVEYHCAAPKGVKSLDRAKYPPYAANMKSLIVGCIVGLLLIPLPAMACLGVAEEYTIFFDRKLGLEDNYQVYKAPDRSQGVFRVRIKSIQKGLTLAEVLDAPKNKKALIKAGSIIALNYAKTSCTQSTVVGEIGTIVVKGFVNSDDRTQLKAYVYQRRYRDGRVQ